MFAISSAAYQQTAETSAGEGQSQQEGGDSSQKDGAGDEDVIDAEYSKQ